MRWLVGVVAALLLLVGAAAPARAQLTFPGASPISSGNVVVRTQPEYTTGSDGVRGFLEKNVLFYGASPDLALIVQSNTLVLNSAPVMINGQTHRVTAAGLGDTLVEARYTVYQQDGVGSTLRIAPYVGVSMPTGMDAANQNLSRGAQPGTGTWGSRDALTASYQTLFWNGGAEVGYQANTAQAGYRFGNAFYADAGAHYLLWPGSLEGYVPAELYASLEVNYSSLAPNRAGGGKVPGTGADLVLIDPGLIYTTAGYSVSFTGQLPAYERVRDNGSRFQYAAIMLLRFSFFTSHHW